MWAGMVPSAADGDSLSFCLTLAEFTSWFSDPGGAVRLRACLKQAMVESKSFFFFLLIEPIATLEGKVSFLGGKK